MSQIRQGVFGATSSRRRGSGARHARRATREQQPGLTKLVAAGVFCAPSRRSRQRNIATIGAQARPAHRVACLAWKALLVIALTASLAGTVGAAETTRVPVLVELFTSEGCSSCPPAAASEPGGEVSARAAPGSETTIEVSARWPTGVQAEVLVALVQDHAISRVERGENAGRTLEHAAIARAVSSVGGGAGTFSGRVELPGAQHADRAIVFVQERDGGRIHGAASVELHR